MGLRLSAHEKFDPLLRFCGMSYEVPLSHVGEANSQMILVHSREEKMG